jgi:site-specific DNA-cytosine methylase
MKVCGVELKGGEAIICVLVYDAGMFTVPEIRQRSFVVSQSDSQEPIKKFHNAVRQLMQDYSVNEIVIIERDQKGKNAGSATSFKLEAALQVLSLPVILVPHMLIKEQLKRNPIQADFDDLGLKKFQQPAFKAAYAYINQQHYKKEEE